MCSGAFANLRKSVEGPEFGRRAFTWLNGKTQSRSASVSGTTAVVALPPASPTHPAWPTHDADDVAPLIHQRPARIARLHRHADLKIARVIRRAGQRRDFPIGQPREIIQRIHLQQPKKTYFTGPAWARTPANLYPGNPSWPQTKVHTSTFFAFQANH